MDPTHLLPPTHHGATALGVRIRQAFERFIQAHGFTVFLVRRDQRLPCICEQSPGTCPYCLGSGFVVRIERYMAMERTAAIALSLPRNLALVEPGILAIDSRYFYLPAASFPKTRDLVVIPHRLDDDGQVVPPLTWYEINHVDPRRVDGHLIYWWAATSQELVAGVARSITLVKDPRFKEIRYLPVGSLLRPVGGDA